MHAAALRVELRVRGARSLKEKRQTVKSVTAQLSDTFGVAVSEVADQEKWQKATLGIAGVAPHAGHLTRVLHSVERYLDSRDDVEILRLGTSYLEIPE